jgi:hypothetical protein
METIPQVEKKKNNKVLLIAGVLLALCCCVTVIGAAVYTILKPGAQTIYEQTFSYTGNADDQLKSDVLNLIAESNGCSDVTLINGQIFLNPGDGSWTETWQVNVCGESQLLSISFSPSPLGGTDFSISRMDN